MTIQATIESGRRLAGVILIDQGTISRGGGAPVFDPVTGDLTPAATTVVYAGPCRIRMPAAVETNVIFGDTDVTRIRFVGLFPWDIAEVEIGDIAAVTESGDPYITSRRFRVVAVPSLSVLTHRKIGLEVVE